MCGVSLCGWISIGFKQKMNYKSFMAYNFVIATAGAIGSANSFVLPVFWILQLYCNPDIDDIILSAEKAREYIHLPNIPNMVLVAVELGISFTLWLLVDFAV